MVELPGWAPRTLARSQSETRTSELRLEAGQIGIFEEHGHVFPRLGRGFREPGRSVRSLFAAFVIGGVLERRLVQQPRLLYGTPYHVHFCLHLSHARYLRGKVVRELNDVIGIPLNLAKRVEHLDELVAAHRRARSS